MNYYFKNTPHGQVLYVREFKNNENIFVERKATYKEAEEFFVNYYDKEINEIFLRTEVSYLKDEIRHIKRKLELYEK